MFDKEYAFKGTHAEKVNKLTAKFDDKNQLFKRNLDVYMMAPIVGFLFQKKADVNSGDGTQKPTKIFPQQPAAITVMYMNPSKKRVVH